MHEQRYKSAHNCIFALALTFSKVYYQNTNTAQGFSSQFQVSWLNSCYVTAAAATTGLSTAQEIHFFCHEIYLHKILFLDCSTSDQSQIDLG